jgi:hypothetical protein
MHNYIPVKFHFNWTENIFLNFHGYHGDGSQFEKCQTLNVHIQIRDGKNSARIFFYFPTIFLQFKGVGLRYGRQLYFHCLLKYMVICAFENPPLIPSFLITQIVYIGYGQLK